MPTTRRVRGLRATRLSLAGRRDDFTMDDLRTVAQAASMERGRVKSIVREVAAAVARWREVATQAGVLSEQIDMIEMAHRRDLAGDRSAR
jgi:serine/threonine-protein kinase HipA